MLFQAYAIEREACKTYGARPGAPRRACYFGSS
jgi:hypothetical protein